MSLRCYLVCTGHPRGLITKILHPVKRYSASRLKSHCDETWNSWKIVCYKCFNVLSSGQHVAHGKLCCFPLVCSRFKLQMSMLSFPTIISLFPTKLSHWTSTKILKIGFLKKNPGWLGPVGGQRACNTPAETLLLWTEATVALLLSDVFTAVYFTYYFVWILLLVSENSCFLCKIW